MDLLSYVVLVLLILVGGLGMLALAGLVLYMLVCFFLNLNNDLIKRHLEVRNHWKRLKEEKEREGDNEGKEGDI